MVECLNSALVIWIVNMLMCVTIQSYTYDRKLSFGFILITN
jgi:hypothetical protein